MKYYEEHYVEYLSSAENKPLHPKINKIYDKFSEKFDDLNNIILYGPTGVGKYSQSLDIIKNFRLEYMTEIVKLSQEMNFFIFEDRKYSEIGAIFKNQYEGGIYQVESWSNLINFHLISGDSNVKVYQNLERKEKQGGLLVAQMSNHNNFITPEYTQKVVKVAQDNDSICGFISQEKIAGDNFLYLTPGIKLDVNKNKDHLDQRYKSISEVIINGGTDIIIVGRGITESSNILLETLKYKDLGWSCYLESLKTY